MKKKWPVAPPWVDEPILSIPSTARFFSVPTTLIRRAISKGEIVPFTLGTGRILLRVSEVSEFIAAKRRNASQ